MQPAGASPELVLPGLEAQVMSESSPGHWIERGPQKRLMVFSGRSHKQLAERIADQLGVQLGEIELHTFGNGETYCRYDESIRGADLFIVQTGCEPVDQHIMELLLMIQAAKLASAKRITAVIPWFPYARQDRKAGRGEGIPGVHPLLPHPPPGSQGEAARADHRASRRGHAAARRRRPRADDGPARRPDPGLLHDPRRPHDLAAAVRAALPRS